MRQIICNWHARISNIHPQLTLYYMQSIAPNICQIEMQVLQEKKQKNKKTLCDSHA